MMQQSSHAILIIKILPDWFRANCAKTVSAIFKDRNMGVEE